MAWWAERFTDELREDWRLLYGQTLKVAHLINRETVFMPGAEGEFRRAALWAKIKNPKQVFEGERITEPTCFGDDDAGVFFINGVIAHHDVALLQRDALSAALGEHVALLYNPTKNLIADLLECHHDRYGASASASSKYVMEHILGRIQAGLRVTIVGYSQGAIIANAALLSIMNKVSPEQLSLISFVSFGAGFRSSVLPSIIIQEHFANVRDPVVNLGLLLPEHAVSGTVYTREASGHLLSLIHI